MCGVAVTTFLDLAIYALERFGGAERANAAARMLLIDRNRHSQLPYAVSAGHDRLHRNELVHRAQDHIEDRLGADLRVGDIAAVVGVSERTLVDATQFRMDMSAMDFAYRDANITRYNAAGVKRFAFLMPAGMPAVGAPPAPEGPAAFPTGYFDTRPAALAWLADA